MDDIQLCPICKNKFRNVNLINKHLYPVDKTADYVERTCSSGMNHVIQLFSDTATNKVDFIKLSLDPRYSKYLEVDFINQRCRIHCMKDGKVEYINVPKMIIPDFPSLKNLKEKVSMFVVFS
jgi:hypothetical protein